MTRLLPKPCIYCVSFCPRSVTRWMYHVWAPWCWMKTAQVWTQRSSSRRCRKTLSSWCWTKDRSGPHMLYVCTLPTRWHCCSLAPLNYTAESWTYWVVCCLFRMYYTTILWCSDWTDTGTSVFMSCAQISHLKNWITADSPGSSVG